MVSAGRYECLAGGFDYVAWRLLCGCDDVQFYDQLTDPRGRVRWQPKQPQWGDSKSIEDSGMCRNAGRDVGSDKVWEDMSPEGAPGGP